MKILNTIKQIARKIKCFITGEIMNDYSLNTNEKKPNRKKNTNSPKANKKEANKQARNKYGFPTDSR
tara:strand:- start:648 stop:848 length:201 start_codon:yes stop_codon:yes gene_type:complete